jgi:hypothetical protein
MKTSVLAVISMILALVSSPALWAAQGGDHSGGGNTAAAEFYQLGQATLKSLNQTHPIVEAGAVRVQISDLVGALESSTVEFSNETLSLNNVAVQAINTPSQKRIVVSQKAWAGLSPSQKRQLIVHELLGLLGIDDTHYKTSASICGLFSGSIELRRENVLSLDLRKTWINYDDFVKPNGPWGFLRTACPGFSIGKWDLPEFYYEATISTSDGVLKYRYCDTDSTNNPRFDTYIAKLRGTPETYSCVKEETCNGVSCHRVFGVASSSILIPATYNQNNEILTWTLNSISSNCQ